MTALARRAHPFTPAALGLALAAMAIVAPPPTGTAAVYGVTILLAFIGGVPRGVRLGALICAPMWILLFIMHGVFGAADDVRVTVFGMSLSRPGLEWALEQGLRLGAIVTASLSFAIAFEPRRFLQAAIDRRWRFDVAFLIVATLDAAERLGEQARRLREAQRSRGLRVSGSIATRARAVPALVFPLMLASLTEADERTIALETRGLTLPGPRTAIDPPTDSALDRVIRWLALLTLIAVGWWRFA